MNDVENIKWRKLKRYIGEEIPEHEDRCYTHEEIHTLVKNASLKLKALFYSWPPVAFVLGLSQL